MKGEALSAVIANIGKILSGTAAVQLIGLMSLPIITRLYIPEVYGQAAYIWSVVAIVSVAACLKFEPAIVLESNNLLSDSIVNMCVTIALIMGVVALALVFLINVFAHDLLPEQLQSSLIYFIPLAIVLYGLQKIFEYKNARDKTFKKIGMVLLLAAIMATSYKWLMGYLNPTASNFLIGNLLQLGVAAIFLCCTISSPLKWLAEMPNWRRHISCYRSFMKNQLPSELLNVMTGSLPVILVGSYLGVAATGFYSMAWMIAVRPISVVGDAIASVYLGRARESIENKILYKDLLAITVIIFLVAVIPALFFGYMATPIISWLLGNQWAGVGALVAVLMPMMLTVLLNKPSVQSMIAMERLSFLLIYNVVGVIVRVGVLLIGLIVFKDLVMAALCFSAAGTLANLFIIITAMRFAYQSGSGE